jgi:hypothetical protein
VVTAIAKLGVFGVVVFIGVTVFRHTSVSAHLSEAWAMYRCDSRVQADLNLLLMERRPRVLSCVGPSTRAVCQVETIEWRAPRGTDSDRPRQSTKTAPLGPWDCSRRHVPPGLAGMVMKTLIDGKASGVPDSTLMRLVDNASPRDKQLLSERDSVAAVLSRRQALADAD